MKNQPIKPLLGPPTTAKLLRVLELLSNSATARLDAREWVEYYDALDAIRVQMVRHNNNIDGGCAQTFDRHTGPVKMEDEPYADFIRRLHRWKVRKQIQETER